jgi:Fe-S cluster assembly iron-binding protein IscA
VTEDVSSSSYRKSDKVIITDGRNLVYFLPGEEDEQKFSEYVKRPLKTLDNEDRKIVRRLIEKSLDIGIRKVTSMRKMQGIYLLEEPIPLYRCEQAKLYLGFSIQVSIREDKNDDDNNSNKTSTFAVIEAIPQSYVRESVLDYVRLRRGRGASANSVINNLTKYRNRVIVAPSGNYGCIVDVIARKAGSQSVSDTDQRNLVEFWKQIYGIDISPDEIPLLKVKMINSENVFTYPPSMCFFGNDSLFIPADVQKFVEYKKSTVKSRMDKVVNSLVNEKDSLMIGNAKLEYTTQLVSKADSNIQVQLLHDVRQKLFGRSVMARGSAMFVHDEIWFFPNQLKVS